jgi:hypothetical protein
VPDQVAEKLAGFKGINVHDVHLLAGQTLADGDRIEIWVGTGENGQHCEYTSNLPKNGPEDGESQCYTGDGHGPDGLVLDKNWQGSNTTLPGLVVAYGPAHSPDAVSALISGPGMAPLTVAFNPRTRYAVAALPATALRPITIPSSVTITELGSRGQALVQRPLHEGPDFRR